MATARPRVVLEFIDDRGNVVVAVDSGARFGGTLRRMAEVLEVGSAHDVMLIFGDEPATMSVSVVHGGAAVAGSVVQVDVITVDVGGIRLAPPPAAPSAASAPSMIPSRAGLTGHLSELPMTELIQLLCATRRTATVEIFVAGDVVGTIAFADGRAVHSRTTGGAVGVDAFYGLAALERGEFAVYYGRAADVANITDDTLFLLLEAARRADEARRAVEDALAVESLASIERALDGALPEAQALTPPPRRRKQRRPADAGGDVTNPGRRGAPAAGTGSGLFSAFFEEFSEARAAQQEERRADVVAAPAPPAPKPEPVRTAPVPRLDRVERVERRERRVERAMPPPPPPLPSDASEGPALRVLRLSEMRTDDIVAAPPFASLAFAADHSGITGEHDTDIIAHMQSSSG